eukprot:CAMPEP_0198319202 /NCGR_PEP_ID=MMETSP1450-20131203/8387_1 /TAXON_ID=753684 ORGANISM="Madagascaria erythrocladiodes, Strain CCMP3234" /NCGR_SAMPLE_ID=MMETSP1450 /ASSEMBLY_ACC=CAM_ASM_001115 /LENGTH=68 /DNA_ID=CAMNT_0044022559 /DNA_START=78 /DNA_END=284 /DNA_ORIENTATION=+
MAAAKPEIDVSKLSDEERKHYEKYGRLKKAAGIKKEKKYFDSADWQMSGGKSKGGPLRPQVKGVPPKS